MKWGQNVDEEQVAPLHEEDLVSLPRVEEADLQNDVCHI